MKVGSDLQDDIRRAKIFRKVIGYDKIWVSLVDLFELFMSCKLGP